VDVPEGWQSAALTDSSLADKPWGELFDKPELSTLIDTALNNNRGLHIAAERVELARARYGIERSALYPSVSATTGFTNQRQPQVNARQAENTDFDVVALGLEVPSWEIDLWGRLRSATEAARQQLLASENTRRALRVSVIAQVSTGYLELLELDAQSETAQKAIDLRRSSLDMVRKRYAGGIAAAIDVRQAEALVAGAEQTAAAVKIRRAQTENNLAVLLGRNPGPIARTARLSDYYTEAPELPAGLPSQLLERRPDVLAAERQLVAAGASLDAARKAFFPVISLTGFLGFASPELDQLFNGDRNAWTVTSAITAPIFTAGRLRSNVESAQAQQRIALEQYLATIQNAFREVDDALAAYTWLMEQRDALQRLVEANRERLRLADIRYRGAVSGYFEVLNAQQDLFESELLLAQVTRSVYSSVVQLYAALGGGASAPGQAAHVQTPPSSPTPEGDREQLPSPADSIRHLQGAQQDVTLVPQDRLEVHGEGDASVIDVYHVTGSGGVAVSAPASGWPLALRVRLNDFARLDRFNAVTEGAAFECRLPRSEGLAREHACALNGAVTGEVRRIPQGFEVSLPALFLRPDRAPIEIHWLDQER
jgi:multidrug efflux system outer membrane protein